MAEEGVAPTGLAAMGVVKRYGGAMALAGVTMAVRAGEVVGLVGHNGAGKSTLLKTLSGAVRPDEGLVRIDDVPLHLSNPAAALRAGISTVYQELSLLENLSVTQNVYLGREQRRGATLDKDAMRHAARALVERFGLDVDVDQRLAAYPVATRQLLEIAVATERGGRFLLLDEPTTSLEGEQVTRLLDVVRSLAANEGVGVLLVNHKIDELYRVADSVVVLVDGEVRIAGASDDVDRTEVLRAIAGDEVAASVSGHRPGPRVAGAAEPAPSSPQDRGDEPNGAEAVDGPVLEVRHLRTPSLHDVSLEARPGRVLGIYGLIGSGRTEFLHALGGLDRVLDGQILLDGTDYSPTTPAAAQRAGVVYLTEERKTNGIVPQLDAATNVMLPVLRSYRRHGVLDWDVIRSTARDHMDRLRVRGMRDAPVVDLSGGNQQKILLARMLAQQPRLLLLDEPTKGVDIGVKAEIHQMLRRLAHVEGLTVVVVSSEEEEVLEVADEVVTFTNGRCEADVRPADDLSLAELRQAAWSTL